MEQTKGPCLLWHKFRHVRDVAVEGASTYYTSYGHAGLEICVRCFAKRFNYHGEKFTPSEWAIYSEALMREAGKPVFPLERKDT